MNKTELIAAVAEKANLSKKDTEAAVNAALAVVTEALAKEEKVQLWLFRDQEARCSLRREPPHRRCRHHRRRQGARFQGRQGSEGRR